jgi:hypothetical protein
MKDELLKSSLRHAQNYINAYGVEWLQEIEKVFRDAILPPEDEMQNCNMATGGEGVAPLERTPKQQVAEISNRSMTELQAHSTEIHDPVAIDVPAEASALRVLAGWHFKLPFIAAIFGVVLLFLRR